LHYLQDRWQSAPDILVSIIADEECIGWGDYPTNKLQGQPSLKAPAVKADEINQLSKGY